MKKPTSLEAFLKHNRSRTFYLAEAYGGHGSVTPVAPKHVYGSSMGWSTPNSSGATLLSFSSIYESLEEAQRYVNKYLDICKRFVKKPYIHPDIALPYGEKLLAAERSIISALSDNPNFDGVDFIEDYRGAVRIRTFHKSLPDYSFGVQAYIEPNIANIDQAVAFAIEQFKANDTRDNLSHLRSFTADNTLGWD